MPESKTDRAHRSNEEISNFLECGDARGRKWLDSHPDARERADRQLREIVLSRDDQADDAPAQQQRLANTG